MSDRGIAEVEALRRDLGDVRSETIGLRTEIVSLGKWAAQFGSEVLTELKHQAESLDDVRDRAREQVVAEAKRAEVYQDRWEEERTLMSTLTSELSAVRKSLDGLTTEFRADHDRLHGTIRDHESLSETVKGLRADMAKMNERWDERWEEMHRADRQTKWRDGILAALTASGVALVRLWTNQP